MDKYRVIVNGESFEVEVEDVNGHGQQVFQPQMVADPAPVGGHRIEAILPGTILEIEVVVGQMVEQGDVLLILEAMKLENEVKTDISGKVKEILVEKGATVNRGAPLIIIE